MNKETISLVYSNLEKNSKDKVVNNHDNIIRIFENDENLLNTFRLNEFTQMKEIDKKPFWRNRNDNEQLWTDIDESQILIYLGRYYGIVNKSQILEVLDVFFYKNSYNPVQKYLKNLIWDGNKRLETLFIDYLGAEDNEYIREVTKISLLGCVLRAFHPGSKHDTVAVLVGKQGIGKSKILSKLGMDWYNESLRSFYGDEAYIKISTSWIVEIAELTALKRGDNENVKSFISAQEDIYRPKYGKYPIKSPRKCVFFGTTNNVEFLKDDTGNRRWLPIQLEVSRVRKDIDEELSQSEIDQVWAEAYFYYRNGESNMLKSKESLKVAALLQEQHREDSGLKGRIEAFLEIPILSNWDDLSIEEKREYFERGEYKGKSELLEKRDKICAWEIWNECFLNKQPMTRKNAAEINQVLRQIDDLRATRTVFGSYGQQRGFLIT